MRAELLFCLALCACSSSASLVGDTACSDDTECVSGQRCVNVTHVRAPTGDCLESSGRLVCRPICASCPAPSPCGCVCE